MVAFKGSGVSELVDRLFRAFHEEISIPGGWAAQRKQVGYPMAFGGLDLKILRCKKTQNGGTNRTIRPGIV